MTNESPGRELYWVGIGASAGGLEAIKTLVQSFPENANLIYIVAQHLSPNHKSMMTELVQRKSKLNVQTVKDGCRAEPNTIYITPPQMDVTVVGDQLHLSAANEQSVPKPSVNSLFVSLAEEKKELAIGIVMSGTGSDGAHGIKKIRAMGGMTIAQEPGTATYDGMPLAAIRTDCVDLILTPEAIGEHLQKLCSDYPYRQQLALEHAEVKDNLSDLLNLVREQCGVSFKQYKKATLKRRIERRMLACGFNEFEKYVDYAKEHTAEVQLLFKDVLISVTEFFRDLPHFEVLSEIIAKILQDKSHKGPVRFWSVGCATGEEAYSLAILLAEAVGGPEKLGEQNYQVFATDVDTDALTVARRGVYDHASMVNIPEKYIDKYFIKRHDTYEVIKPIKDIMLFAAHNIIDDPPFLRIDLITCRNLLIYFEPDLQKKIYSIFHYALRPKSYMFLGKSESISQAAQLFHPVHSQDKIFQRRPGPAVRGEMVFKTQSRSATKATEKKKMDRPVVPHLHESLVRKLGNACVLINDNFDIEHIYGDATPYISLANGKPALNLADIINDVHKQEIRALGFKALRINEVVTGATRRIKIDGELHQDRLVIYPLQHSDNEEKYLLVCFVGLGKVQPKKHASNGQATNDKIDELESELATAKEHLQTVIEELETSNEELQSLNEELQSSNEELQSSNEELETTNEELQSANEELVTMNDELNSKTIALEQTTSQLVNVKNSLSYPLLVVDEQLRVIISNKRARKLFAFEENGKELKQVLQQLDDHAIIMELVSQVLDGDVIKEIQLEEGDRFYWLNIAPFTQTDQPVSGVILSFTDNTDMVKKNIDLIESRKKAQAANVAKTEFLANVSHEIRTPLNAIYGVMEIYKLTLGEDERHRKLLKVLENSAITLKELLDDLLDFAKLEAGKLQLERVCFSLQELLEKIIDVYSIQASEKGIELTLEVSPDTADKYIGDPLRIHQILANLLSNALKFTTHGSVKITVTSTERDDATEVKFEVADTGIGIQKEELQRIFDKFSQSDTSISRRYGGTGLGLAIVKELVHLMNGKIDLRSKLNDGTTFTITLPLLKHSAEAADLEAVQNKPSELKRDINLGDLSLLIVEDNVSNIFILSSYLDQLGCRYDVAESGFQGLDLVRKNIYDCIFLDIQMDEMDGFQFYERLRAFEAEQNRDEVSVIAVSGNVQRPIIDRALEVGMKTFIPKPIELRKLEQALIDYVCEENSCAERT